MPRIPGPLPHEERRRRNAPTIPTTNLPAAGRQWPRGRVPNPPSWITLGANGTAWWRWAWKTPQAAAWASGHEAFVARRAQLEDDLRTLEATELDLAALLGVPESDAVKELEFFVRRLHAMATGRLAVAKECRELDDRLGLSPKAMAALRWKIVEDGASAAGAPGAGGASDTRAAGTGRYGHLRDASAG